MFSSVQLKIVRLHKDAVGLWEVELRCYLVLVFPWLS